MYGNEAYNERKFQYSHNFTSVWLIINNEYGDLALDHVTRVRCQTLDG